MTTTTVRPETEEAIKLANHSLRMASEALQVEPLKHAADLQHRLNRWLECKRQVLECYRVRALALEDWKGAADLEKSIVTYDNVVEMLDCVTTNAVL